MLELSKILIYEFWCDYVKLKHCGKVKLYYMDTDSLIVYLKTDDIYEWYLLMVFMKDELGGKIMTKFVGLRAKTYSSYLIDESSKDKKAKGKKKCGIKRKLEFKIIKSV